jgi:predicted short-subunit dehydrogenase-like oxidoreductase (DUF2520 family)
MRESDRHAHERAIATANDPAEAGAFAVAPGGPRADADDTTPASIAIVGRGRAGTALARAFRGAGLAVEGPLGRGERPGDGAANGISGGPVAVLLCVPDGEIAGAVRVVAGAAPLVGHTSGATPLSALEPAAGAGAERFGLHPLQTLTGVDDAGRLAGSGCAIAGSTPRALEAARGLAKRLGLEPFEIADEDRAAYHAAASAASNFLVTLEDAAEAIAEDAGMGREEARRALVPLVRATVENWAALGPEAALTGPVARGDEGTVASHRAAVERGDAGLLPLFDALVERTRHLAARQDEGRGAPIASSRSRG